MHDMLFVITRDREQCISNSAEISSMYFLFIVPTVNPFEAPVHFSVFSSEPLLPIFISTSSQLHQGTQ
jgi:hypothetical protein